MKEKALYIASNLFPVNSGATIYTYGNILRFTDYFDVDLLSFVQCEHPDQDPYYNELISKVNSYEYLIFKENYFFQLREGLKHRVFFQKYSKEFKKRVISALEKEDYKYVFIEHILIYYLIQEIRLKSPLSKIITIEQNIEFQNLEEDLHFSRGYKDKLCKYLIKTGIKGFELNSVENSDYSLFISTKDMDVMNHLRPNKNPKKYQLLKPFFPFKQIVFSKDLENKKYNLLILGSMWWYPNIEGVKWFIKTVFPLLIEKDNRYKVYIVGNGPSKGIQELGNEKIIFTGKVASVDEYIKDSDFLIVPTFTGGGVKIKIMEGILKGIPVISRTENIVGYEDIFTESFHAVNPQDFVNLIISGNNNPKVKTEFVEAAKKKLNEYSDISDLIRNLESD